MGIFYLIFMALSMCIGSLFFLHLLEYIVGDKHND